jgi:hypothetical protein
MASIFEKKPFYKMAREWDAKTKLNEVYKLQSNDPRNKYKAKIPKDLGGLGIEFTLDRTITKFIRGAERVNVDYVQSFAEFGNVLQGRLSSNWKQVLDDHFPEPADPENVSPEHNRSTADSFKRAIELFLKHTLNEPKPRDRQWIYMMPGGDYRVKKDLLVSPLDHLHWFKEMLRIAQMLPEGDIPTPNAALQVEWFYMTFHRSDRAEYLRSGRKLCDKTLASLAEYLESRFDAGVADGSLHKLRDEQVRVQARNKYRHVLQARYHDKLKRLTNNNRKREYSWRREDRDGSSHGGKSCEQSTYCKRKPDAKGHGERKTTHEQAAKNKPCHVHGPESKHSYDECRTNPKNQRSVNNNNNNNYNKRAHDAHYNDERYLSSQEESPEEHRTPEPSDDEGEVSANAGALPIENYHLNTVRVPKKRRMGDVPHKSPGNKTLVSSSSDTQRRMSLNLAMDDMFRDDVSMDLFLGQIGDGKTDAFFK